MDSSLFLCGERCFVIWYLNTLKMYDWQKVRVTIFWMGNRVSMKSQGLTYRSKEEAFLNMVLAMLVYTWEYWTLSGKQEEHNLKVTVSYVGTSHKNKNRYRNVTNERKMGHAEQEF